MSRLREALAALRSAEEGSFGECATYRPADGDPVKVVAVPGRTVFRQRNEYGAYVRTETRDFVVRRDLLPAEPRAGDEIEWAGRRFEVLAPGGEPAWRWSDPLHVSVRIHTKHTGGES